MNGEIVRDAPDEEEARGDLHESCEERCADEAYIRRTEMEVLSLCVFFAIEDSWLRYTDCGMQDFKSCERLCPFCKVCGAGEDVLPAFGG